MLRFPSRKSEWDNQRNGPLSRCATIDRHPCPSCRLCCSLAYFLQVSLDPAQQPGAHSVQLLCVLEDRSLPCVPPILVSVPESYPASSPHYILGPYDYTTTSFLKTVQEALEARVRKLPTRFSVSQLLDTWEISVRQACAPTKSTVTVSSTAVLLGL